MLFTPPPLSLPPDTWRAAWPHVAFRRSWLLLLVLLFGVVVPLTPGFFAYIQQRPGPVLADPLLALLPRRDVADPLFGLMYGSVVVAVGWLTRRPRLFLRGLWGYWLVLVLRMATIWLLPLAPPPGLVPLIDPITSVLFHTASSAGITKDLFFSAHVATVTILGLAVRGRWLRGALWAAAATIGVLVLVQGVHYSYDVLAAPFFAWFAYWVAGMITRRAVALPTLASPR